MGAYKSLKVIALAGMSAVLAFPVSAQETSQTLEESSPAIELQVLETQVINLGDHFLYINAVAPPVFSEVPFELTLSAAESVVAALPEAAEPQKNSGVLFLSTTVYDRKVTEIRWRGVTGEHRVLSNIDFNLLSGTVGIETSNTTYTLMLVIENNPAEETGVLPANATTSDWVNRFGSAIPTPASFSSTRAECLVIDDQTYTAPAEEELAALEALHAYFDAHKQVLVDDYAANAERASWLEEHPPVPPDIVVNFWRQSDSILEEVQ